MNYFLESCCTSDADAVVAQRFGARRIELCSRLDIGGVTPSEDLIRATLLALAEDSITAVRHSGLDLSRHSGPDLSRHSGLDPESLPFFPAVPIPVNVLVRPRGGDFVYTEDEIQQTIADIGMCKRLCIRDSSGREHRVNGVVVGALQADGGIDMAAMRRLVSAARPLHVTFHRAFDECSDVGRCLEDVIALGCDRLLTSGHEPDAFAGRFTLARLVRQSAGRIVILAGCGVRPHNIAAIASASSAPEFHSSTLTGW
jgi:copper homeostasis protein